MSNQTCAIYYYEYYDNKKYHKLFGLNENNELDGLYEEYYQHTNYSKLCNYQNYNYSNRQQIKIRCYYLNGKLNGKYTQFFENGSIYIQCNYSNGNLHGKYIKWFNNFPIPMTVFSKKYLIKIKFKCKRIESNYLNGELDGIVLTKHASGKLFSKSTYVKGKKISSVRYQVTKI